MKKNITYIIIPLALIIIQASAVMSELSSTSYQIPSSVVSNGGSVMGSLNFQTQMTLGQPTPLTDVDYLLESDNYILLSGFWSTYLKFLPLEESDRGSESQPPVGAENGGGGGGGGCFIETLKLM